MKHQDREAFGRMMFALGDTFNEPVSELRVEAYFDALSDLATADVLAAGRRSLAESKFFPRPVELRELVNGSMDDQAEAAWSAVRQLVRRYGYLGTDGRGACPAFPDEATRRAALELYGGWVALCSSLPAEGPEFLGARKAFIAGYKAYANRERRETHAALPPSISGYLES